jgi:hypothetical protein
MSQRLEIALKFNLIRHQRWLQLQRLEIPSRLRRGYSSFGRRHGISCPTLDSARVAVVAALFRRINGDAIRQRLRGEDL